MGPSPIWNGGDALPSHPWLLSLPSLYLVLQSLLPSASFSLGLQLKMASERTTVVTSQGGANALPSHVGDFLNRFAAQGLERRASTRQAPLSAEEHA
ncbi:hypothetical protein DL766_006741 [Monosporascus sp. MC13-8B]|uniref:Uncharacterized protein n=1 Tax=Monosporascus cannonballus TaxID=155416 RepID=A0ABY0H0H2_9PEZI|nr:hypothetical protein DL762_006975 [Monosporascus cannonballus]RYO84880.1 hypothetical protein DL763_007313 [Monosporascus cannonballus]RYP26356.1 hypothetical protein DL766_006741 [Monosporascus sp. MC13-8B]